MIGGVISGIADAGVKTISSGIVGIKALREAREKRKRRDQQMADYTNWYVREYNSDGTQRAEVQAALRRAQEYLRERGRSAAGRQAVMGATDESAARDQAAGNDMMAGMLSQIASDETARKDALTQQYQDRANAYYNNLDEESDQKIAAWASAAKGVQYSSTSVNNALQAYFGNNMGGGSDGGGSGGSSETLNTGIANSKLNNLKK